MAAGKKQGLAITGMRSAQGQPVGGHSVAREPGRKKWNLNTVLLGVVMVLLVVVLFRQGVDDAREYRYSTFMIGTQELPEQLKKQQQRYGANVKITWLDVSKKIPAGWEYVGILNIDMDGNTWHMIRKPKD